MSKVTGNIFWRHIKASDIVVETPNVFIVNGTHLVNWQSIDAVEAQTWLKTRARADKRRSSDYAKAMAATIEGTNIDGSSADEMPPITPAGEALLEKLFGHDQQKEQNDPERSKSMDSGNGAKSNGMAD